MAAVVALTSGRESTQRALAAAPQVARWLVLAEDYAIVLRWRNAIAGAGRNVVDAGDAVNDAAMRLRRPFLALIAELGREHASPEWWASRVSERNPQVSSLFLHVCWTRVVLDALEREPMGLGVVCDSAAVLRTIAEGVERPTDVNWTAGNPMRLRSWRLRAAARSVRFLAEEALRRRYTPRQPLAAVPEIIIRTWVEPDAIASGAFRDRYFPGLADWLRERGEGVATLPVLAFGPRTTRAWWKAAAHASETFLGDRRLLTLSDRLQALHEAARAAAMPRGSFALDGVDLGRLVDDARRRAAFDRGTLEALLARRLPRRMRERGIRPKRLILEFENMIPDKALIQGFREELPETRLVGFQHGALYPLFLCNFVPPGEVGFAPLPDRVVCNGAVFRDVLVAEGLPSELAVVGAALRYAHLHRRARRTVPEQRLVLVPLPLNARLGTELVHKLRALVSIDADVQLKPHPLGDVHGALGGAGLSDGLPARWRIVVGELGELLEGASVVVAMASSSLYEAVAAGVPVVVVGQDCALDLDPLQYAPGVAELVRRPEALVQHVERLLDRSDSEQADFVNRAEEILRRSFEPVETASLEAFLG